MEWTELLKEAVSIGGNLGVAYLVCYTVVELAKVMALGIVGYKGCKAFGNFFKYMLDIC